MAIKLDTVVWSSAIPLRSQIITSEESMGSIKINSGIFVIIQSIRSFGISEYGVVLIVYVSKPDTKLIVGKCIRVYVFEL